MPTARRCSVAADERMGGPHHELWCGRTFYIPGALAPPSAPDPSLQAARRGGPLSLDRSNTRHLPLLTTHSGVGAAGALASGGGPLEHNGRGGEKVVDTTAGVACRSRVQMVRVPLLSEA